MSATAATTEKRREGGGRSGAPQVLGSAWRLRLAGVPEHGLLAPQLAVRSAERPQALRGATPRPRGERAWASGPGHSGLAREEAPCPRPLAPRACRDDGKFYLQLGAGCGWWDSPALCSVSARGRVGRAGGGDGPLAVAINYYSDDRHLHLDYSAERPQAVTCR